MSVRGFTLAELLIALVIIGEISTFTIPKVLQSQQDVRYKVIAKEVAGSVSEAYQMLQAGGTVDANSGFRDLTPYLNYVRLDTTTVIDDDYAHGTDSCGNSNRACLMLHNGAAIFYKTNETFNGTASTNVMFFRVDPDGKSVSGVAGGPGKSQEFLLYFNGRLEKDGDYLPGSTSSWGTYVADPTEDAPWFSWN